LHRPELTVRKVLTERLTIATANNFRGALTLANILQQPFIMIAREVSGTFYDHCIRLCGSAGFSPRVVQEAKDMFTLLNLVRAGIGVALVPGSAKKMRVNGVKFGHIRNREAEWDIGVAWNRLHESTLMKNFVEICLEHSP
jgi:DNA-binding transcriptional LysR family regulator